MSQKIFTIGSLTVDIFVRPKRQEVIKQNEKEYFAVPFGEKVRVEAVHELFGGGAANTAIALARMGIEVNAVGAVGYDNWAESVLANLKEEKVGTDFVHKIEDIQTGFSVILNSFSGERTVLVYSGANRAFAKIDSKIFEHCDGLHLCHLAGEAKLVFEEVRDFFKTYPEKLLSWNPGNEQLDKGIEHYKDFLPVVDILLLNKEEAEKFTNVPPEKEDKDFSGVHCFSKIFRRIFGFDFQGKVIITDGKRGAQGCDGKQIIHCPIDSSAPVVDTLGAGDAFGSTFFGADLKGKSLPDALRAATVNSASVVASFGTYPGLLSSDEIEEKMSKLKTQSKEFSL